MFDKLKKAFSNAAKGIGQKEITEKVLGDTLFDLEMSLLESDVAQEAVESLSSKLKKELVGARLEKGDEVGKVIQSKLQRTVAEVFANAGKFDLIEKIKTKKGAKQGPYVIVFLGINGTGKTTTVAKIANMIRKHGLSVVVAAGDTHRAGAIEQLSQHASNLSLKVIAQRYGADPSAVGRDAVEHARKNHIDAVLVDTAGRMQTSRNLMDEMAKIVRVVKPDAKLFIGDALAGNDTINQAREFFQYSNFDGAILTKIDADAKGGAAISIAHITSRPIVYVGVGQGYDDIIPFEPDRFIESLFGTAAEVKVEDLMSQPRVAEPKPPEEVKVEPLPEPAPAAEERKEIEPKVEPASPVVSGIFAAKNQQRELAKPAPAPIPAPAPEPKPEKRDESRVQAPAPAPVSKQSEPKPAPEPELKVLEPSQIAEEPKEKKGRFGLFKKKSEDEKKKEEERKRREEEERAKIEEERARAEEEERKEHEKAKEEKKKRKTDKDNEEDKVIYLTDEDIEDLLK